MLLRLLTLMAAAQKFEEPELSESECLELGYNPKTLKCHTCKLMPQYNLEVMLSDCEKCCSKETEKGHEVGIDFTKFMSHVQKYPFAQIEICECNLQRFPQVNAFVKSDLSQQWGNKLRIRHVRGTLPTIVLKDASGQPQKTLNIEKWDTDTITEFVNDWLE